MCALKVSSLVPCKLSRPGIGTGLGRIMGRRPDRRRHRRARIAATATAFLEHERLGDYLVENVSASGALISLGPLLAVSDELRISLALRNEQPLSMAATVVRSALLPGGRRGLGLEFRNVDPEVQDTLQQAVLRELEAATEPAVLVVGEPCALVVTLSRDVVRAGRGVLYASTPLEAIGLVEGAAAKGQVVLCLAGGSVERTCALISVLGGGLPEARCVAVGSPKCQNCPSLPVPWGRAALASAMAPGR